jgi:hypothetical protein
MSREDLNQYTLSSSPVKKPVSLTPRFSGVSELQPDPNIAVPPR